jgi:hypothetical protein
MLTAHNSKEDVMTASVQATTGNTAWQRRGIRALAIVGGAAAALVVWALAKYLFDAELRGGAQPGGSNLVDIQPVHVIVSTVMWTAVGWALLAILERFTGRARTIWTWVAVAGLLVSFVSPLVAANMTDGTKLALSVMHVAVAAVVIPVFVRTSRDARGRAATA